MANLNDPQPPPRPGADAPEPFEGFLRTASRTGSLELSWPPFAAAELHAWILLRDPERLTPDDLHPERLLAELIRIPLASAAGQATAYVPVGRALGVMLVARTADGEPCPAPPLEVRSGPPVTRVAPLPAPAAPAAPPPTAAPAPSAPPRIDPRAYGRAPLVFAENRSPPDFEALARRVADRAAPPAPPLRSLPPLTAAPASPRATSHALPPALAPAAPPTFTASPTPTSTPTHAPPGPAGFGARQRWTLTRLAFPVAATPSSRRLLVARTTFIGAAETAAWTVSPPPDAIALPPQCDGLVDGLSPEDAMVFYLVLEARDGAWHALTPTPVAPPFDECKHPLLLGDPAGRLALLAARPAPTEAFATLVAQAISSLEGGLPSPAPEPRPASRPTAEETPS